MVKKKLGLGESNFIKKGELKMNDTYKQRLTSAMEHFNISSLGELNEDDHKIFFTYVDDMKEGLSAAQKKLPAGLQKAILAKQGKKDEMHDMKKDKKEVKEDLVGGQKKLDKDKDGDLDAKDFAMLRKGKSEMKSMKKEYGSMMAMKKMNAMKDMKKEEKTKETDSEPKTKDLNAMMNMTAMKAKPMNAMKDMNAMYMKSNVKAAVMNNGGSDMAKVKDAPDMKDAMKKINATYGMKKENNGRYLQTKPGSLEEAVLVSRGLVKKSLNEANYMVTYDYGSNIGTYGVSISAVVSASSPQDAMKKGHDKLEKLAVSPQGRKLGVDELQDPDDDGKPEVKITNKPLSYTDIKKFKGTV
jgi:hypothetical protein